MDDKKRELKKFFHDYSAAITTTALLIFILVFLLLSRYSALVSIKDLSKINPLITSEQNELVAASDSNGVMELTKEDIKEENVQSKNSESNQPKTQTGGTPPSSGGTNGNGTGNSGGSSGGTEQAQPFTADIGQLRHFATQTRGGLGSCSITHEFEVDITSKNSPGTISYRWVRSDGQVVESQYSFTTGETEKTLTYAWPLTSASGSKWIRFEILTPVAKDKLANFQHTCSLL